MQLRCEVAIVGFGPVGMVLAGLLGKRGVQVVVVEQEFDVFPLPRAAHIDHTGLRTLQELGCLDEVLPRLTPNRGLTLVDAALEPLVKVPGDQGSVSGLPASMYFYQPDLDRTLDNAVNSMLTVDVRRGVEMVSFDSSADAVNVRCVDRRSGNDVLIEAGWLIGCDGAWSLVRETEQIVLDSLGFDEQWLVLDLRDPSGRDHVLDQAIQVCDPRRPYVANPIPGGRYRAEFSLLPDDDPEQLQERASLDRLLQPLFPDVELEIERSAVYTFHGLLADSWRRGRVLLAGDAAHQMPPFLGQGMCSGIRDATNLAWKLTRVVRQGVPHGLLDTYAQERAPHVRAVASSAVEFGRFVSTRDPEEAAARDRRLLAGDDTTALTFNLPPLPEGPLVGTGGGALFPQPTLEDGARLDDVVGDRFLLVTRTREQLDGMARWWRTFDSVLMLTVDALGPGCHDVVRWLDRREAEVVVVRPDRCVFALGYDPAEITAATRAVFEPSDSSDQAVDSQAEPCLGFLRNRAWFRGGQR